MRWAQQQRRKFILERLRAGERVIRADLEREFRVGPATASNDLGAVMREAPGAMVYDINRKGYFAGPRLAEHLEAQS